MDILRLALLGRDKILGGLLSAVVMTTAVVGWQMVEKNKVKTACAPLAIRKVDILRLALLGRDKILGGLLSVVVMTTVVVG